MTTNGLSRRNFITKAATIGAAGVIGTQILSSCSDNKKVLTRIELGLPPMLEKAPDGKPLKAGVIGCGGRGTGAALNFLAAGSGLTITALGDVFQDRVDNCKKKIEEKAGNIVEDKNCFVGFDAFEKVIDSGVDMVILATPPHFRPMHFEAAIKARKHAFIEKPVAVDPVGCRSIMANARKADSLGLKVIAGTQRRHQHTYVNVYEQVMNGAIGDIKGTNAYWDSGKLWHRNAKASWSEMEAEIRNWVNWSWLSGDHIVEQHVHNLDVIHWFTGMFPEKASGFGSRQRRITGNQYDNFSIDFTFENKVHNHSMCRQMNGCDKNVSEFIQGSKGYTNCKDKIWHPDGSIMFEFEEPLDAAGKKISPYNQEHVDWVTCIRQNTPINEAEACAKSTLAGVMGRMSAYTGRDVTWEEAMNSDLHLGPKKYFMGDVDMNKEVPVPGEAANKNVVRK
jgi:myo-inositol 2-dehydrogenase/D-chiro-inositol 1-dehydrogenase